MARIRSLKVGFFKNEKLAALSPIHRLLFAGLWVLADREGRMEDRPLRIRAELFPYEERLSKTIDGMLADLADEGFIQRYVVGDERYIQLPNFGRHQLVSRDEPASEIPGPSGELSPYERPPNETVRMRIYQRDGFVCVYCGRDMSATVRLRCVDHVIPYARGGSHRDENLVTCCKACNAKKGCRTPDEADLPWPKTATRRSNEEGPLTEGQHPVNGSGHIGNRDLGIGNRDLGSGEGGEGQAGADAPLPAVGVGATPLERSTDFAEAWNRLTTPPIPRCRDLTPSRKRSIRSRLRERPLSEWESAMARIEASDFCRGQNDRTWVASFDWLIGSPDVVVKVLEGKYDNRTRGAPLTKRTEAAVSAIQQFAGDDTQRQAPIRAVLQQASGGTQRGH